MCGWFLLFFLLNIFVFSVLMFCVRVCVVLFSCGVMVFVLLWVVVPLVLLYCLCLWFVLLCVVFVCCFRFVLLLFVVVVLCCVM